MKYGHGAGLWALVGKLLLAGGAVLLGAALADIVNALRAGPATVSIGAWLALAGGALALRLGWRLDARFDRGGGSRAF